MVQLLLVCFIGSGSGCIWFVYWIHGQSSIPCRVSVAKYFLKELSCLPWRASPYFRLLCPGANSLCRSVSCSLVVMGCLCSAHLHCGIFCSSFLLPFHIPSSSYTYSSVPRFLRFYSQENLGCAKLQWNFWYSFVTCLTKNASPTS